MTVAPRLPDPMLINRAIRGGIKRALNRCGAEITLETREDLCSTAWVRLLEYAARIEVSQPASLAYRISYYLTLKNLRRPPDYALSDEMEAALPGSESAETDQIDREDEALRQAARLHALQQLSGADRAVIAARLSRAAAPRGGRRPASARERQQEARALSRLRAHSAEFALR